MPRSSTPRKSAWQCPRCGRRFTRPTREHSCDLTSISLHLRKTQPEIRAAYRALSALLDSLGPHRVIPLKSMVCVAVTSNFAGLVFGRSFLDVSFFLTHEL